jgi:hypothetical protein
LRAEGAYEVLLDPAGFVRSYGGSEVFAATSDEIALDSQGFVRSFWRSEPDGNDAASQGGSRVADSTSAAPLLVEINTTASFTLEEVSKSEIRLLDWARDSP